MKTPKKTVKIYSRLKESILKRRYLPGECLPKETEFAESLGCARDTLRRALARLEAEKLVRRVRGQGTFVSSNLPRRKITVLLPCAGTIRNYSPFLADQMTGVLEEASKQFCEIELIPVSPNNDPQNIDFSRLFNLDTRSRVFFSSFWFENLFEFLSRSQCRVAMICDDMALQNRWNEYLASWTRLRVEALKALTDLIKALAEKGCRRPLFIMRFWTNSLQEISRVILDCCREYTPEVDIHQIAIPVMTSVSDEEIESRLKQAVAKRQEYPFDAVVVDLERTFDIVRRYNPEMYCGFINRKQHTQQPADPRTLYSDFDYREIGAEAVRQLLRSDYSSEEIAFEGRIIVPEIAAGN